MQPIIDIILDLSYTQEELVTWTLRKARRHPRLHVHFSSAALLIDNALLYRCGTTFYDLGALSYMHKVAISRAVGAPGHG